MKSKYLQGLPQYHFDRDEFVETFKKVFSNDEIFELEVACQEHKLLFDFYCTMQMKNIILFTLIAE